jgi:bifunctional non-homologous end joining protein LigD
VPRHKGASTIVAVGGVIEPMLATAGRVPDGNGWAVEPKLDGWRATVTVTDGQVQFRTRAGRNVTDRLPEFAGLGAEVGVDAVLDGELVARQGRAGDFYDLAPRMVARRRSEALTFVAFDVLVLDGTDVMHLPYRDRRHLLELLELDGATWCTCPSYDSTVDDVLAGCVRLGLEGVVAKKLDSVYRPGHRSRHWRKVTTADWRTHHARLRHER